MEIAKLILEYIQVLIWPSVTFILSLLFKSQIVSLFGRIKTAKFPGGVSVDLSDEVAEAEQLSNKVQESLQVTKKDKRKKSPAIPLTEANARLLDLGFRASPSGMDMNYYRKLALQDPNIALAGLRLDLDILSKNLAQGFNIPIQDNRDFGVRLLKRLVDANAITLLQYHLAATVFNVCNKAIHGVHVSYEQAISVINSSDVLIDDYLAWLSWGFDDNWESSSYKNG